MEVMVVAGYCVFTIWHSGARPWCCQKLGTGSAQPSPGPVRAVIRKIYRLLFVYCPLASQNKVRVTRCYLRPNTLWAMEWCQRWSLNVFQSPVDTLQSASLVAQTKGQWSQGPQTYIWFKSCSRYYIDITCDHQWTSELVISSLVNENYRSHAPNNDYLTLYYLYISVKKVYICIPCRLIPAC